MKALQFGIVISWRLLLFTTTFFITLMAGLVYIMLKAGN